MASMACSVWTCLGHIALTTVAYASADSLTTRLFASEARVDGQRLRTGKLLDRNAGEMLMLQVSELAEAAHGLQINHHCDNPACINPEHLYAGTHEDNVRDMIARNRASAPPVRGLPPAPDARTKGHAVPVVPPREGGSP